MSFLRVVNKKRLDTPLDSSWGLTVLTNLYNVVVSMQSRAIPIQKIHNFSECFLQIIVIYMPLLLNSVMFVAKMTKLLHTCTANRVILLNRVVLSQYCMFSYQHQAIVTELAGLWLRSTGAGKAGLPLIFLLMSSADCCSICTPYPGTKPRPICIITTRGQ